MEFWQYNASPLALTAGMVTRPQVDATGALRVTSGTAAANDSTGAAKAPVYTALGYRPVTATDAAFNLPTPPAGTRFALIQAEAQGLRWRDDGTAPTATVGMLIPAGGELRYDGANMGAIRLIAATTGAIANISYYG